MKSLLNRLKELCEEFPLKEKIVVVDSYFIGEQINEAFNLKGYQCINLKYKTVYDLASETIELHHITHSDILDRTVAEQMMYSLLIELKSKGSLKYFAGMEITPSFSKSIFSTISLLRKAGYSTRSFPFEAFISDEKAHDLSQILEQYEQMLSDNQLLDEAEALTIALGYAHIREDIICILQSDLHVSYLEEEYLNKILPEKTYKLPMEQVRGIQHQEKTSLRSISWGEASTLSYIYDQEQAEELPNLSFFTAKTEELEVKAVFERLKSSPYKLDETIFYYTNTESYVTLLYHLSQNGDIPITFGDGLPISFSRPGRLVSGLLKWIQTNYSVQPFLDLMQEGLIDLGEDAPSKAKVSGYLRDLQIGWSKVRYIEHLEKEIDHLKNSLVGLENEEKKNYLHKRLRDLMWLTKWFQTIFKRLPHYEETMNYRSLLEGVTYLLKNYCQTKSALHEGGKSKLLDTLEKVIPFANETRPLYEIFEKVKELLLSLRIHQSNPKPGYLHVTSYHSGIYNSRPNVFILGLDNRNFPGAASEDPLLLDKERIQVGRSIPILQNTGQENLYKMLQLLAHSQGSVTLSYSNFDINDNRAVSPAHIFLQCYRFATGNKDADFKEIKNLNASLTAEEIMENKDFWNQKLSDEKAMRIDDALWKLYENMKFGLESEKHRQSPEFSEYDGLVEMDKGALDPRINKEKHVSAAKLETLAKCPYSYFLQDVLRVRPIEDVQYDPYKWLDAATRGSLLHSIFETFYKELNDEKPAVKHHEEKILTIANNLIQQQKEIIPPPNERIFNKEVQDIRECCRIFLKEEETHGESYKPLYFEYTFGLGEHEPAIITLPSGATIQVAGKIDRVDESNTGHYHIIDYKTGSTYGYGNKQIFKGGRQLQHMIYALAIEQHLQLESGKVQESAYYFPTVKGLAERVVRKQDDVVRTNGGDILERLIDVLKTGTFTMTDDENDCKFCDFKSVCRRQFYDKDVLEMKQSDKSREELRRFKGVRAYE